MNAKKNVTANLDSIQRLGIAEELLKNLIDIFHVKFKYDPDDKCVIMEDIDTGNFVCISETT